MGKILTIAVLVPILAVAGYVGYLWATYLDETLVSGAAYGFTIGASKQEALAAARSLDDYPHAVLYISYGPRAGDHFSIAPSQARIEQLQAYDQWDVLFNGSDKFFNSVRLTFNDNRLVEIHRHRQRFEMP
ncbi:hypothetical protein M8R20_32305 [Pseudomonas sp. R2.Fl]|nr:hypothetical protein [Pseudomonas sp. R2.Fl]